MTLRLLVRVFANLVNIASQLSTLPFDAFVACSLVIFCDFYSKLRALLPPIPKVAIFLCPFSYGKIYF
jgi:hypothetical protein